MLEKTNIPGYFKDTQTKAVVNNDHSALQQYKLAKQRFIELNTLSAKVDKITADMDAIKIMLSELLSKKGA